MAEAGIMTHQRELMRSIRVAATNRARLESDAETKLTQSLANIRLETQFQTGQADATFQRAKLATERTRRALAEAKLSHLYDRPGSFAGRSHSHVDPTDDLLLYHAKIVENCDRELSLAIPKHQDAPVRAVIVITLLLLLVIVVIILFLAWS